MFEFEKLPKEETVAGKCAEYPGVFTSYGLVKVKPSNCVVPGHFEEEAEKIRNFEVRDDDVYVISSPKCGTTWTMEMVWLIANDMDFDGAKAMLDGRFIFIDLQGCASPLVSEHLFKTPSVIDTLNKHPGPRFIKSHLPKAMLPAQLETKKPKIIFVARNAKDAAVSNFHHYKTFHNYTGTLEEFLEATLKDEVMFSPFWEHIVEFWEMRNDPNVLFLTYEDMKKDLSAVIDRTAQFLGKEVSAEQKAALENHLSFNEMKKNRSVNYDPVKELMSKGGKNVQGEFMRAGKSDGWKESLFVEMTKKFDEWTRSKITGTGLEDIYLS